MSTITAVFEKGVFRPLKPVLLPEHTMVEFEPKIQLEKTTDGGMPEGQASIYEVLSRRYKSGHPDTSERHDEHQP